MKNNGNKKFPWLSKNSIKGNFISIKVGLRKIKLQINFLSCKTKKILKELLNDMRKSILFLYYLNI